VNTIVDHESQGRTFREINGRTVFHFLIFKHAKVLTRIKIRESALFQELRFTSQYIFTLKFLLSFVFKHIKTCGFITAVHLYVHHPYL
jgi:hypothetical protein